MIIKLIFSVTTEVVVEVMVSIMNVSNVKGI